MNTEVRLLVRKDNKKIIDKMVERDDLHLYKEVLLKKDKNLDIQVTEMNKKNKKHRSY